MTRFVAEFTTNHMGNLNVLQRMVERAAWAGCDAIKMQKKDVESFYSREKLDAPFASPYGKSYRDYRTIFEFCEEDFRRFDAKCREHGIEWFCTVQDLPSLRFMLDFDLKRYKVASSNARNRPFLEELARNIPRDRTIVMSVGGSTLDQIEDSLSIFRHHPVWLLHCVAEYPCPPESLRLGNILSLERRFGGPRVTIGYSGHEIGIAPTFAAIDQGAKIVERHFCLSRHSFVHHIECSLEPDEFREMVRRDREGRRPGEGWEDLPETALSTHFGMTNVERSFLVEQTYGNRYVGDASRFEAGRTA
ncbi:MAG: N-acetylneuraminate synthase family protein [Candidatus Eisenbacteria bacterium]|nr:N-acetylneuraminate synthase family protein [Candidatus Eisenbacteria bacterium]